VKGRYMRKHKILVTDIIIIFGSVVLLTSFGITMAIYATAKASIIVPLWIPYVGVCFMVFGFANIVLGIYLSPKNNEK
jgi:hypothetical protein